MKVARAVRLAFAVTYLGLLAVTLWFLSLDTLAQANWILTAAALLVLTGLAIVVYAVGRYQRMDELSQRIHLSALAVATIGSALAVFVVTIFQISGLADDYRSLYFLIRPAPFSTPPGVYLLGLMLSLYLIGWVWGRIRYR